MIIFLILGLLLGGLTVVFALQNISPVSVTFLAWQFDGSLALVLVLAVVAGMLISSLLSMPRLVQRYFQVSNLRNKNAQLKDELTDKEIEVEAQKSKVAATNAYLDDLEKPPRI